MAVPLTGAGGLFVRLGHLGGILLDINFARGGTITAPDYSVTIDSKVSTVGADYAAGSDVRKDIVDGIYQSLASWKSAQSGMLSQHQQYAVNTIIQMVYDATKQPDLKLASAMAQLIVQMKANGDYLTTASSLGVGSQTAVGTPNGNPIFAFSTLDGTGLGLDYMFPETFTLAITSDSQSGGATLGSEPYSIKGQVAQSDPLAYNWPLGSGAGSSASLVPGTASNASGNLSYNGDFEKFTTANYPDNWVILVGTAGTDVLSGGSSNAYTGSSSVQLHGDGATLVSIYQQFNQATSTGAGTGGTPATLTPLVPYCVNFWYKMSAASPAAGVLTVDLTDGTNTVVADAQSNNNSATITLTSVGDTSWHNFNTVFRLPANLPSTVRLRIRESTAITSGKSVYIDSLSFTKMNQVYTGGPFFSGFSGATKVLVGASWTNAVTTTYGGFPRLFERWFGMRQLGLRIPTAGSVAIADTLIV